MDSDSVYSGLHRVPSGPAAAKFDDEVEELKQAGAQAVYNYYAEAGYGFGEHVREMLGKLELKIED